MPRMVRCVRERPGEIETTTETVGSRARGGASAKRYLAWRGREMNFMRAGGVVGCGETSERGHLACLPLFRLGYPKHTDGYQVILDVGIEFRTSFLSLDALVANTFPRFFSPHGVHKFLVFNNVLPRIRA